MKSKVETYERQPDGTCILVSVEEKEIDNIEIIKNKEEQLLQMYAELEELKKSILG
jgi:hypothetical protein